MYDDQFIVKECNVDGVEKWLWPKGDSGLWDGPMTDWKESHKHKIMQHCKNFRVAVQAGGACGMYPRLLSNIFSAVYTFEPCDTSFHCLVNNCPGEKIIKLNAAVGATPGLVSIKVGSQVNVGTNKVEERGNSSIPRMTIDSIPYQYCDLIMLDVEGYEKNAIEGARNTIKTFHPTLFVERGSDLVDYMAELGYIKIGTSKMDIIFAFKEN